MKIRTRIVLILVSIFFGIILVFSVFIYVFNSRYAFDDFYKRLEIRSYSTARAELDEQSAGQLIREFKGEYLEPLMNETHFIVEVNASFDPDKVADEYKVRPDIFQSIRDNEVGTYRENGVFYCGIQYQTGGKTYYVVTSAVNYYYSHHVAYFRNLLISSIFFTTVLVVLIAYWLSKRLINPIQQITADVNRIGTESLHVRLEGGSQEDELGDLVRTFNNMLDRLETSFETQNNFISNASHELNTPLTAIIGEADVALARPRSHEEYVETLQNILEEAEKLDKKTKALLYLAQTGFNGKALKFDKVRMDQLIFDVKDTINRIHPDNKVQVDLSMLPDSPEKLKIKGNEQLLHLALSNIILNAYKYSHNKKISVSIGLSDDHVILVVKDEGIGIPKDELQYIYDPFFRASNTRNFEGYGIGLPLTRNIIKLHHGEMVVSSKEKEGTTVEIRIPIGGYTL